MEAKILTFKQTERLSLPFMKGDEHFDIPPHPQLDAEEIDVPFLPTPLFPEEPYVPLWTRILAFFRL